MSGPTLVELLARTDRKTVVDDCARLVDAEVADKSGLGGMAIKGAYATVKAVKPGFIPDVIDAMLDEWLAKLEPHYQAWKERGSGAFGDFIGQRSDDVAEDLLAVTDGRARVTRHKTVQKLYDKLRPSAKRHVSSAVPRMGAVLARHIK
jgi:hypothetical protein